MIAKITRTYVRRYSDSGQVTTYVEWVDGRGKTGRTEGAFASEHMQALLRRAERDGITLEKETW